MTTIHASVRQTIEDASEHRREQPSHGIAQQARPTQGPQAVDAMTQAHHAGAPRLQTALNRHLTGALATIGALAALPATAAARVLNAASSAPLPPTSLPTLPNGPAAAPSWYDYFDPNFFSPGYYGGNPYGGGDSGGSWLAPPSPPVSYSNSNSGATLTPLFIFAGTMGAVMLSLAAGVCRIRRQRAAHVARAARPAGRLVPPTFTQIDVTHTAGLQVAVPEQGPSLLVLNPGDE